MRSIVQGGDGEGEGGEREVHSNVVREEGHLILITGLYSVHVDEVLIVLVDSWSRLVSYAVRGDGSVDVATLS